MRILYALVQEIIFININKFPKEFVKDNCVNNFGEKNFLMIFYLQIIKSNFYY